MSQNFQRQKWNVQAEGEQTMRVITSTDSSAASVKVFAPDQLKTQSKAVPAVETGVKKFKLNELQGQLRHEQENARLLYEKEIEIAKNAAFEEGLKKGFAQGHQEGVEAGKAEGHQKYLVDMRGNVSKIQELTLAYESAKSEIYAANERALVQIAFQVAKKIVLKELSTDQEYISRLVKDVIDRLGIKDSVRVKVSPKDLFRLENLKKELTDHFSTLKNVTVESSDRVSSGCIVETDFNVIDAQVETQLNEILGALIAKTAETEKESEASTHDVDPSGK